MTKKLGKLTIPAALAAGLVLAPALAQAELATGTVLGTTVPEVSAALDKLGYTISEIETEDGRIEAEVTANNREFEIEIDAETGKVLELEDETD